MLISLLLYRNTCDLNDVKTTFAMEMRCFTPRYVTQDKQ